MDPKLQAKLDAMKTGEVSNTSEGYIRKGSPMQGATLLNGVSTVPIAKSVLPKEIGQLAQGPSPQPQSDRLFHNLYHHRVENE